MEFINDIKQTIRFIQNIQKQVLYAGGLAINDSSIIVNNKVAKVLDSNYDITTSWSQAGNKYGSRKSKPLAKNGEVSQFVGIKRGERANTLRNPDSTDEHWIIDHEFGSIRKPKKAGGDILIPTKNLTERIGSTKGREGRAKVRKLTNRNTNDVFEMKIKNNMYMFSRPKSLVRGKKRYKKSNGRFERKPRMIKQQAIMLFLIKDKVKIRDTLSYARVVIPIFRKEIPNHFGTRFRQAIKTMRYK